MIDRKSTNYDNESITALKGADRVRKRPSVIFGSDDILGCEQAFFEVLSNSIDEAREGFGKEIKITRFKDKSIEVIDHGRGIPVDFNQSENRYNWELIFCELYAGGKYETNETDNYGYSLGTNGLGLCSTQYASKYMEAKIIRDGYEYSLYFEEGENIKGLKRKETDSKDTGTTIKWLPDLEVFTDIDISLEYYLDILKRQSVVNPNLKLILYDEESDETYEFLYENGIMDYVEELADGSSFTEPVLFSDKGVGKDRSDKPEYKLKYDLAFCFDNEVNVLEYYHNSSYLEYGGSPDKAIKSALLAAVDGYMRENDMYRKDEKKITFTDIEDSLILICSSFSTITSYENQTKRAINNKFIQDFIRESVKTQMDIYLIENKLEADKIANQIMANKRSRESAESARINIRRKLSGHTDMTNRVKKFVDCRSKDKEKRELYIVEGDSALGSTKLGRDAEFQAIMPIRGKILNCLKADYDRIFNSDIIVDLLKVLGCGVEIKSKHNKNFDSFDMESLNWSKVIICTDADVDGFHIRTMVLAMFYRLAPQLIDEKKIFIAESPLYEINAGKETYFAYNEIEKNEILSKIKGNYRIQRSKGLGENEPEMMWKTTMNPETRRLISVVPEDIEEMDIYFDTLLGNDISNRKIFIEENGHMYLDMTEVV